MKGENDVSILRVCKCENNPCPYESINAAVDAAEQGDIILVENGVYNEAVTVDVANLKIIANGHNVILDGQYELGTGFDIDAGGVEIRGFIIKNYLNYGIDSGANGVRILYNDISNIIDPNDNLGYGIFVGASETLVWRNRIENTSDAGIYIDAFYNWIIENCVKEAAYGIYFFFDTNAAVNNTLIDNTIGIYLNDSNILILYNKIIDSETDGIVVDDWDRIVIIGNRITENSGNGIHLFDGSQNFIGDNVIKCNEQTGIRVSYDGLDADFNSIEQNVITENKDNGILIKNNAEDNFLYKNLVKDNKNFDVYLADTDNTTLDNKCEKSFPDYICDPCSGDKNKETEENNTKFVCRVKI